MRQLAVFALVTGLVGLTSLGNADQGGEVKCKVDGLHLCCATCDNTVKAILGKVDGVSNVKVDRKAADKVTFTAKSDKEAKVALDALIKGGFCCDVTAGSKNMKPEIAKVDFKGDSVTFNDVHICCGACTTAVKGLFTDAKVTVNGKGAQKSVTITGKNLDAQVVAEKMQKAGFTGVFEAKK
ncbi:MAG TPA: heavy metal-associated domain-containing protein [Gemmataceae bacterium]|nr:heavy metal-associated domain-containing protein [Gemmataceae bacterium]